MDKLRIQETRILAENKTKATTVDPNDFIARVDSEQKRKDSEELIALMKKVTGKPPKMWGPTIIGFGKYHYKYDGGHEGDMCVIGLSPRKQNIALYIPGGIHKYDDLLEKLGKHKTGKGCLYINSLQKVDAGVLKEIINRSMKDAAKS